MNKIAVLGLGKVGALAAELLHQSGFDVTGLDINDIQHPTPFKAKLLDLSNSQSLFQELSGQDAVLSCLPYHLNISVAEAAHETGIHYFDLTEDVPTTKSHYCHERNR